VTTLRDLLIERLVVNCTCWFSSPDIIACSVRNRWTGFVSLSTSYGHGIERINKRVLFCSVTLYEVFLALGHHFSTQSSTSTFLASIYFIMALIATSFKASSKKTCKKCACMCEQTLQLQRGHGKLLKLLHSFLHNKAARFVLSAHGVKHFFMFFLQRWWKARNWWCDWRANNKRKGGIILMNIYS
jgi:hypothetical protein